MNRTVLVKKDGEGSTNPLDYVSSLLRISGDHREAKEIPGVQQISNPQKPFAHRSGERSSGVSQKHEAYAMPRDGIEVKRPRNRARHHESRYEISALEHCHNWNSNTSFTGFCLDLRRR